MKVRVEILGFSKSWAFDIDFYIAPQIYLCPSCQVIWARLQHLTHSPTNLAEIPCEKCPPAGQQNVPGSLIFAFPSPFGDVFLDESLLGGLPRELLVRELNLHIKAYQDDCSNSTPATDPYLVAILARTQSPSWS